jgi:hypothetical protein
MADLDWATRILSHLLREEDATALLGDLREDYERRSSSVGRRVATRCYRREVRQSIAAALRLQGVELLRSAPWGIAFGSYVAVGVAQFGLTLLLARIWPEAAQTSALNLAVVFPVIAFIAYVAARFHRTAPFLLGAMMLAVAATLIAVTRETISTGYMLAFLTLGPAAAVLGGSLHRARRTP